MSPGRLLCEVVLEQSPGENQREKWHMWTRTFQAVGSVTIGGQLREESGGWDLEVTGSSSFRALKAFSPNELGAIRELGTGCRVLEDCIGCCQ